jgi:hypothetical protein
MTSQKRIAASQQNGAKSRGPITDLGKARSSRNAIRHGILSCTVVLDNEDPKAFKLLLDQHVEELQPNGDLQHQTVEQMAICQWKLRRLNVIETTLMDDHSRDWGDDKSIDQALAQSFVAHRESIAHLERYSSRLTREYHRAFRHLQELRKLDPLGSFGKNDVRPSELPAPPDSVAPPSGSSHTRQGSQPPNPAANLPGQSYPPPIPDHVQPVQAVRVLKGDRLDGQGLTHNLRVIDRGHQR